MRSSQIDPDHEYRPPAHSLVHNVTVMAQLNIMASQICDITLPRHHNDVMCDITIDKHSTVADQQMTFKSFEHRHTVQICMGVRNEPCHNYYRNNPQPNHGKILCIPWFWRGLFLF